jgi:hypothetical protein
MKRAIITVAFWCLIGFVPTPCCAGVLSVVKHLAGDAFHGVKYELAGVAHGIKHAAHDVKTVLK